ncbi:MAG: mercuric transport protein MerTP [Chitinophagaceae bacterium]|nr:MAG: mercuric transport protein MerTP [Chitinophagaceae bacterium]
MNHQKPSAKAKKSSKGIVGAGLLTALAASLCCITPVLALFSGATGIASTFSWMEPYRPYLIGLTIAVLAFAWYQKLIPNAFGAKKAEIDCGCEVDDKPSFWQSKKFLGIVTILAFLLMAFPSYSKIFFPKTPATQVAVVDKNNVRQVKLNIRGMDCRACSQTINLALSKVPGVLEYNTDYKQSSSIVKFDPSKTTRQAIVQAVNKTGYTVARITNKNQ